MNIDYGLKVFSIALAIAILVMIILGLAGVA